ncbi:MAG: hypothetical protein C5B52_00615 [Bacteroidetes bacterium]|nr:MAG: hypothetical protein C5B52_00615 [Bacteroidota bacterium]
MMVKLNTVKIDIIHLAFFLLFISCNHKDEPANNSGQTKQNLSYGDNPAQKMDYYPAVDQTKESKVMIMIHGGGWATGDKSDFDTNIVFLRTQLPDYAVFNLNYRLVTGSGNKFPTQENDISQAVEFIFNNRNQYHLSDKFVLLGASAGGHLALLQAYKHNSIVSPKAVVSFFGPTDLAALYDNPPTSEISDLLALALNGTPSTNPDLYEASSPVNYVKATSAPTILLQGGLDPLISPSQAYSLQLKLQSAGVVNQLVFYPNEGHGWVGADLVDSYTQILAFLRANVQ